MISIFCTLLALIFINFFCFFDFSILHAEEENADFSIVFGWKTGGSEKLLAQKAALIKQLKEEKCAALSFGSLLGSSRIVEYDRGIQFLSAAKQAGYDYIIPAAPEFMFGFDTFKRFANNPDIPQFISANLINEQTKKPVLDPYTIWYGAGQRICIIAMSDTEIIKQANDAHVGGLDIISYDEALNNISLDVARENADLVIVAGRMDRNAVTQMAVRYPYVDIFITNNMSGGFSDKLGTTSNVFISGKPVYIGSGAGNHISQLSFKRQDDYESREFKNITITDDFSQDNEISSQLSEILETLKKKDFEESVIVKTGNEVAAILKKVFDVDVVLLERQSLYYYPLKDSLTFFDVDKIIKPYEKVTAYTLKGSLLKSVWEQSKNQTDPAYRLLYGGITADAKVDSIPLQDDMNYSVLTTTHLREGGNGYNQFVLGVNEIISDENMLQAVESYLVAKEERLKEMAKKKIWDLNLYMSMHSDFDKKDIDSDKALYGDDIPKGWRQYTDYYQGNFLISSQNNKLTMNKIMGKHSFNSYLEFTYSRKASKTSTKSGFVYDNPKNSSPVDFNNIYSYDLPKFPIKPYFGVRLQTFLYSGVGKHPITASIKSGAKRQFPSLFNLELLFGIHGTRDYSTLNNTFGLENDIFFNKEFPAGKLLKTPLKIDSKTFITWNPLAAYYMAFNLENDNTVRLGIAKKITIAMHFKANSYRNNKVKKVATGYYYFLTLDYGMNWKF
ncbi:MAG: hypothetical protein JXB48_22705 [Candidatus Latescibacteria bacterium]|nr:hypothetical protein [Candidatus Latescibacterota bacterium]